MDGQAGAEADPYACAEGKEPGAVTAAGLK